MNPRPLKVEPIPGEPTRYLVASRSRAWITHLVDLDWDQGQPGCGCEQFQVRGLICHHIRAAQMFKKTF